MTQVAAGPDTEVREVTLSSPPLYKFRKICILGFTEHRKLAPYNGPGAEEWGIWGLNDLYIDIPEVPNERVRWFQLHTWMEVQKWASRPATERPLDLNGGPPHPRDPNHIAWLATHSQHIPVFVRQRRPEIPLAYEFPYQMVFEFFARRLKGYDRNVYFTNSISYMIGLAIMELIDPDTGFAVEGAELGVWGVDMMMSGDAGSEYSYQRPSVEYLLGYAQGAGIQVHVPIESDLLKTAYPYGDEVGAMYRARLQAHRKELSRRRGEVTEQLQALQSGHVELSGAINVLDWTLRAHMPGDSELGHVDAVAPKPHANRIKTADLNATTPASDGRG